MEIVGQMEDQTLKMVVGTVDPMEAIGTMKAHMINQITTMETMGGMEETVDQMGDQILIMEAGIVDLIMAGTMDGMVEVAVTAEDQNQVMEGIMVDHMEEIVGGTAVEIVAGILTQAPRI